MEDLLLDLNVSMVLSRDSTTKAALIAAREIAPQCGPRVSGGFGRSAEAGRHPSAQPGSKAEMLPLAIHSLRVAPSTPPPSDAHCLMAPHPNSLRPRPGSTPGPASAFSAPLVWRGRYDHALTRYGERGGQVTLLRNEEGALPIGWPGSRSSPQRGRMS